MTRQNFRCLIFLFALFSPVLGRAEPILTPAAIDTGGVSLLRWQGEMPESATARFNGRYIPLLPGAGGSMALLGADLELPPGLYPVVVTAVDPRHGPRTFEFALEVRGQTRPEERLTLPEAMVEPQEPAVVRRIERERKQLAEIYARDGAAPLWRDFMRPVEDPLGSPFGLRRVLNGKPKAPHAGVDFRSPRGTPVRAPGRGEVAFAGNLYYTGGTVILDHGGGLFSVYAHLDDLLCTAGEVLEQGTVLGRVGSTGRSTGPHLHWGFKLRGDRVDPWSILSLFQERKGLDSPFSGRNN